MYTVDFGYTDVSAGSLIVTNVPLFCRMCIVEEVVGVSGGEGLCEHNVLFAQFFCEPKTAIKK